jgi:hypothetical protein
VSAVIWVVEESFGMTLPGGVNRARNRRILIQGQVRPRLIIIASVRFRAQGQRPDDGSPIAPW